MFPWPVYCTVLYHPTITAVCHPYPGNYVTRIPPLLGMIDGSITRSNQGPLSHPHRHFIPAHPLRSVWLQPYLTSRKLLQTNPSTESEKLQMGKNMSVTKVWKTETWDVNTSCASSQSHCSSRAGAGWFWFKSTRVITSTLHRSMKHWMQIPQSGVVEVRDKSGRLVYRI